MDFERLELEVSAANAGLSPVKPGLVRGDSGVLHRFDALFAGGSRRCAFDFYDRVTEVEVVRSFAKKYDTGIQVSIVCGKETTDKARDLAKDYGMRILRPDETEDFFSLEQPVTCGDLR